MDSVDESFMANKSENNSWSKKFKYFFFILYDNKYRFIYLIKF